MASGWGELLVREFSLLDVPRLPRGVRLHFDSTRGEHVLLAPERAFHLDETAIAVLELVDADRTVKGIVDELETRYDAPRAVIEADVMTMLNELMTKRVVDR